MLFHTQSLLLLLLLLVLLLLLLFTNLYQLLLSGWVLLGGVASHLGKHYLRWVAHVYLQRRWVSRLQMV